MPSLPDTYCWTNLGSYIPSSKSVEVSSEWSWRHSRDKLVCGGADWMKRRLQQWLGHWFLTKKEKKGGTRQALNRK
eukprot:5114718-Amphidinium_carterae.1